MAVKDNVLRLLEESRQSPVSGETIAKTLLISRTAVWKAVASLRKEGYLIEAKTNQGYMLLNETDILSKEGIILGLEDRYKGIDIHILKSVDSTNIEAKKLALAGCPHGTLVVSEAQTAGKGRMGRSFFSPAKKGIYMTLVLRPEKRIHIKEGLLITTAVSVAVTNAIAAKTGLLTQIKWVNDIYYQNKKIAGILTEAVTNFETGLMDWAIVGIGINMTIAKSDFSTELQKTATSLFKKKPETLTRNDLIAAVVNHILAMDLKDRSFLKTYRQQSMLIGEPIIICEGGKKRKGFVLDIDEFGGLVIENEQGKKEVLSSGEISIRKEK